MLRAGVSAPRPLLGHHLPALRPEVGRNWGIGDFEDLARLAEIVAAQGGDFLGVNPLHALYPADPERCSPYSPSSRRFLNMSSISPPTSSRSSPASSRPASTALRRRRSGCLWRGRGRKLAALEAMFQAVPGIPGRRIGSRRLRGVLKPRRARRSSATACSRRCTSITPARRGGTGRTNITAPTARRYAGSAPARPSASPFSPGCSGSPTASSRAGAGPRPGRRHAHRALSRHGGRRRARRRHGLGRSQPHGARRPYRRAAGCLQSPGPGLGADPAAPDRADRAPAGAVPRRSARQHAQCRVRCGSTMPWRCSACSGSRPARRPPRAPMCAIRRPPCWPPSPRSRASGTASSWARRSAPCRKASGAAGRQGISSPTGCCFSSAAATAASGARAAIPAARSAVCRPTTCPPCSAGGLAATSTGATLSDSSGLRRRGGAPRPGADSEALWEALVSQGLVKAGPASGQLDADAVSPFTAMSP
jgi:hypothetical protein